MIWELGQVRVRAFHGGRRCLSRLLATMLCPAAVAAMPTSLGHITQTDLFRNVLSKYEYIMIPDDDLFMSTHVINSVFAM